MPPKPIRAIQIMPTIKQVGSPVAISPATLAMLALLLLSILFGASSYASSNLKPIARTYLTAPAAPARQSVMDADKKSFGCISCHTTTDRHTMHANPGVVLGCTDCHGGDAAVIRPADAEYYGKDEHDYRAAMARSHVLPQFDKAWNYPSSANPERSYTLLNKEANAFVRFMNPGDLRVAREACGACHLETVQAVERSLMSSSAMLWGGASYNNGILPYKRYILGESYTASGQPATIKNPTAVNAQMTQMGILPSLAPLPAWEIGRAHV